MPTKMKRFIISVPNEMEEELDKLKQEIFYKSSQSEMLRHLLKLGLEVSKNNS